MDIEGLTAGLTGALAGLTAGGDLMVFVKVRETYDLHTVKNKMTVIAIHTPDPQIIKRNWAGLLMNCKFYRPVSADVVIACASVLPVDPQGVGVTEGDVAPEDLFNPILYKACSNESFSLLESRILAMNGNLVGTSDLEGDTAIVNRDGVVPDTVDDFNVYYGLLSDAHGWRHANPQRGLEMRGLKPFVHEILANFGGVGVNSNVIGIPNYSPSSSVSDAENQSILPKYMRGNAKPMPRFPTTVFGPTVHEEAPGFGNVNGNSENIVPYLRTVVAGIIVPPSRLHELYYRMVVEWTIEFSDIRTLSEIAGWAGLASVGYDLHLMDYDFGESKTISDSEGLAAANVDLNKVM